MRAAAGLPSEERCRRCEEIPNNRRLPRILLVPRIVIEASITQEPTMRHNLISYQTKPGRAEENRALSSPMNALAQDTPT